MDDKTCTKCKETKPLSDFYVRFGKPQSQCKRCVLAHNRVYAVTHREVSRKAVRLYRKNNIAKIAASRKLHRENNVEKLKEYERSRWRKKKEALTEKFNLYKQNNRDKFCEYQKRYANSHPIEILQIRHKRRARLTGASGSFTKSQWVDLVERFGNKCLCCGVSGEQTSLTIDHVQPIARGGSNDISNIQPLCRPCNSKKHTRATDYRVDTTLKAA